MPSPLDKTLLHLSFTPVPACSFALRLITHILLPFSFDIFGISGRVLIIASASALVRVFLALAEPPGMVSMLTPVFALDVTSLEVSFLLSVSRETHAFILHL